MPSTVCRGSSGISSSPSVALAFSKLLEASHRDIPCQALAWPGVCAVRLHCARLHTGVGVILPAGDSKGASCLRRASPQSGAGGFEHTRPLCSPFPPPLQPSLLAGCSDLVVGRLGSELQRACPGPAAASVPPLDHKGCVGFVFSLSLCVYICASVLFLVF